MEKRCPYINTDNRRNEENVRIEVCVCVCIFIRVSNPTFIDLTSETERRETTSQSSSIEQIVYDDGK